MFISRYTPHLSAHLNVHLSAHLNVRLTMFTNIRSFILTKPSDGNLSMSKEQTMALATIYAAQTVSSSDLRKNPCQYFSGEPVAVLSRSKTAGYMVGKELFEHMVGLIEEAHPGVVGKFNFTDARLEAISHLNAELILSSDDNYLEDFAE